MTHFGNLRLPVEVDLLSTSEHNNVTLFIADGKERYVPKDGNEASYRYQDRVTFVLGRSINPGTDINELGLYSRVYVNKEAGRLALQESTGEEIIKPFYGEAEERYEELKQLPTYSYIHNPTEK